MLATVNGMFGLVVRFELVQGREDAFDTLVAETVEKIRSSEPGTLIYISHEQESEPRIRIFYELYHDAAAFEAHEQMPHVRRFLMERRAHLASDPLVWRVSPNGGLLREELVEDGA